MAAIANPTDEYVLYQINSSPEKKAISLNHLTYRCFVCESYVKEHTKHCGSCNRCCDEFDHHCNWLNNCIGTKNYKTFIALIYVFWIYVSFHLILSCILVWRTNNKNLGGSYLSVTLLLCND